MSLKLSWTGHSVAVDGLRSTNHLHTYTIFSMSQRWHESEKVVGRYDKKSMYGFQCLCSPCRQKLQTEALEAIHILFVTEPTQHLLTFMPSLTHATLLQTECSYSTAKDTAVDWWHIYLCKPLILIICTWWSWEFKGSSVKKRERFWLCWFLRFLLFSLALSLSISWIP